MKIILVTAGTSEDLLTIVVCSTALFEVAPEDSERLDDGLIWARLFTQAVGCDADPAWTGPLGEFVGDETTEHADVPVQVYSSDIETSGVSLKFKEFVLVGMTSQSISKTPPQDLETGINQLATVGRLLDHPELARVYVYVCYYGPVTRPQIKATLEIPKTTVYDHVETLDTLGIITLEGQRPMEVTADPVRLTTDGFVVTPTILHAVALQEVDEDISYFVERHGVGKLAAAVRQAGLHYAGQITQRMAADPLAISTGEAISIILALKPVIVVGREYDPYFDAIFPEIVDDIEFETDIDVTAPLPDGAS